MYVRISSQNNGFLYIIEEGGFDGGFRHNGSTYSSLNGMQIAEYHCHCAHVNMSV